MGLSASDGRDEQFREQFPADFISEALDQTRGWFYSQLAISTLLFGEDDEDNADRPPNSPARPFPIRSATASCWA